MRRAQKRDAARQERFFFRRAIYPDDIIPHEHSHSTPTETPEGSSSPSPSSPHPPHSILNECGSVNRDSSVLPAQAGPTEATHEQRDKYEHSSGMPTPDLVAEHPMSPPKKIEEVGATTHSSRDPPISVAQSRCPSPGLPTFGAVEDEYEELSITEIINGKGESFPGLLGVVNAYLNTLNVEFAAKKRMRTYLNLIKWRADGRSAS